MVRQDRGFDPIVSFSLVADSGIKNGFIKGEALLCDSEQIRQKKTFKTDLKNSKSTLEREDIHRI